MIPLGSRRNTICFEPSVIHRVTSVRAPASEKLPPGCKFLEYALDRQRTREEGSKETWQISKRFKGGKGNVDIGNIY